MRTFRNRHLPALADRSQRDRGSGTAVFFQFWPKYVRHGASGVERMGGGGIPGVEAPHGSKLGHTGLILGLRKGVLAQIGERLADLGLF
jgi:hypothetical protein